MEPYWLNEDGSQALEFALGDRSRLTRATTKHWVGKCVMLDDIFNNPDYHQASIIFKAIDQCPDSRLVVLTANTSRMREYLERCQEDHRRECKPWYTFPPKNVWFGTKIDHGYDKEVVAKQIMGLLCAPTAKRLLIVPADFKLCDQFLVPKCKVCGGRGYTTDNPFAVPTPEFSVCTSCPAWALVGQHLKHGEFLQDKREKGGELNWVIFTPAPDNTIVDPENIELCKKYGTPATFVSKFDEFDPNTIPLWREDKNE